MVSFEKFVKSMPPSLSKLKVIPSFCFAFKIPDDVTASITYVLHEYMKPLRCNSLCVNYKGPSYIIDNTFEFAYKSFATLFILKWEILK